MSRVKKRGTLAAAILFASVLGAWAWARGEAPDRVRPTRRDVVITVPVEGELEAASTVRLGAPRVRGVWNFKISFMAPEGSEVRAGDPVLGFDTSALEQQQFRKTAERDSAAKELEKRRLELEKERRTKELTRAEAAARLRRAELELTVPAEVEASAVLRQAEIDRELASLELASLESSLRYQQQRGAAEIATLERRYARTRQRVEELGAQIEALTVRAPRDGTVVYVTERSDEKRKIGDTVSFMSKVVELPELDSLRAQGFVAENDAGRLRRGQPVRLRFDAFPDTLVEGRVARVRRTVQTKPSSEYQAKIVRLEIALENADDRRMRPGMRFRGAIEADRVDNALVVPKDAVFYGADGAYVKVDGRAGTRVERPSFGLADDEGVAILSGLEDDVWLQVDRSDSAP